MKTYSRPSSWVSLLKPSTSQSASLLTGAAVTVYLISLLSRLFNNLSLLVLTHALVILSALPYSQRSDMHVPSTGARTFFSMQLLLSELL